MAKGGRAKSLPLRDATAVFRSELLTTNHRQRHQKSEELSNLSKRLASIQRRGDSADESHLTREEQAPSTHSGLLRSCKSLSKFTGNTRSRVRLLLIKIIVMLIGFPY